ncbi:TPA: hypothetical protein NIG69_006360 [Pseudomonas aeruginosa]|nr:hypothetical protein [Pseudomonas aeruginosa]
MSLRALAQSPSPGQLMKDSELVHAFLERVITSLEVGASGAIVQRED